MKLFYILMLTALFGVGCANEPEEGGELGEDPSTNESYIVVKSEVNGKVLVESGGNSVELDRSTCIGVLMEEVAGLKIAATTQSGNVIVLCDSNDTTYIPCRNEHVKVALNSGGSFTLENNPVDNKCGKVLGVEEDEPEEEETETPAADDTGTPAADTTQTPTTDTTTPPTTS